MWLGIEVLPLFYQSQILVYCYYTNPQYWSGRRDLNPQHPVWKTGALPIELLPHDGADAGNRTRARWLQDICSTTKLRRLMVWVKGFEPSRINQRFLRPQRTAYFATPTSARSVRITSCIFVIVHFHYIKIMNRVKIQNEQSWNYFLLIGSRCFISLRRLYITIFW